MRISVSYGWEDGSSVEVLISDDLDNEYNPIRTSELASYARDLLRNAVADVEHRNAEHEQS